MTFAMGFARHPSGNETGVLALFCIAVFRDWRR